MHAVKISLTVPTQSSGGTTIAIRAGATVLALLTAAIALLVLYPPSRTKRPKASSTAALPLASYDARSLRMPCSDLELSNSLGQLCPRSNAPTSDLLHFWRLCSVADGLPRGAAKASFDLHGVAPSCARIKSIFLSDTAFRARYPHGSDWLLSGASGLAVRRAGGRTSATGEQHPGQFLCVLAECGMPLDEPVTVNERAYHVSDLVAGAERDYLAEAPAEFLAAALAVYLPPQRGFLNRFDERIAFDDLVGSLTKQPHGEGSCYGTHACYALAAVLAAHRRSPILAEAAEARADAYLAEAARLLSSRQHLDGAWRFDWSSARRCREPAAANALWGAAIQVTGHHLEWLAIAPRCYLPPNAIERALRFTARRLRLIAPGDVHGSYCAWSHAARSLLQWRIILRSEASPNSSADARSGGAL